MEKHVIGRQQNYKRLSRGEPDIFTFEHIRTGLNVSLDSLKMVLKYWERYACIFHIDRWNNSKFQTNGLE